MSVKYLKGKGGKIVGEIWQGKKKLDTGTVVIIGGITAFALIATGYAWYKMNNSTARVCHTCGGG